MDQYDITQKIINIVKALYDGFECTVVEEEATSEWFELTTGVRQRCTKSGFLFMLIVRLGNEAYCERGGNRTEVKFTSKLEDLG